YTKDANGNFIVETLYPAGDWLFPYLSSFGADCEVLSPIEVRSSIAEELKKMLHLYS
ncbi:MAG: hypothetical protein PWP24_1618, partial [Clostridiales bacterium]|nr:hypothetical protein [Clostridiales bacterium]